MSSSKFARGALAKGMCDRCGLTYRLSELKEQWVNRRPSGLRVCEECLDIDHEQLRSDTIDASDAIALRFARPDINKRDSQSLFGWGPVRGLSATASVGPPVLPIGIGGSVLETTPIPDPESGWTADSSVVTADSTFYTADADAP